MDYEEEEEEEEEEQVEAARVINNKTEKAERLLLQPSSSSLSLYIDPGTASPEQIAELLSELSTLYRMVGGSGITFTPEEVRSLLYSL